MRSLRFCALIVSFSLVVALLLVSPGQTHGAQMALAWDPGKEPGLAGYRVYYGTTSRRYAFVADAGKQTTLTITGLTAGVTYYFAATSYDAAGGESALSNEVAYTVPLPCNYAISPGSVSLSAAGGTGNVAVTTSGACNWSTANLASWVSITSGAGGSGNGTVKYAVSGNKAFASRTTNVAIAGAIFTIMQAGAPLPTYTITAGAGTGGSIAPSGSVAATAGTNQNFTITPASGHNIAAVIVDGASVGTVTSYTFSNVTAGHTISAAFTQIAKAYTLAVTRGGTGSGGVTRNPSAPSFPAGTVVTLTAIPGWNSAFSGWSGACSGTSRTCTLTMTSDTSVTATFNARWAWWGFY